MARTVDPARHEERRLVIIDAALTCFARDGYDRATTAAICREAGIGSGTFFHYFPAKADVLLAILELGTAEVLAWFAAQVGRTDARAVLEDYVEHTAEEMTDPRVGGFVRAVGAVMTQPDVAAALARDEQALHDGLLPWMRRAMDAGQVRDDLGAERLVLWVRALLDGYLGVLATAEAFDPRAERVVLADAVRRLLRP
jgi:AcrR family transcriptional regulator